MAKKRRSASKGRKGCSTHCSGGLCKKRSLKRVCGPNGKKCFGVKMNMLFKRGKGQGLNLVAAKSQQVKKISFGKRSKRRS